MTKSQFQMLKHARFDQLLLLCLSIPLIHFTSARSQQPTIASVLWHSATLTFDSLKIADLGYLLTVILHT